MIGKGITGIKKQGKSKGEGEEWGGKGSIPRDAPVKAITVL
jgi:hypothetical protein